jgi:hypothetical protein
MSDPVERMVKFVMEQKRQAAFEHARSLWSRRLPALLPCVREVVEVFQGGLEEPAASPVVAVLVDPGHELSPLVIAFDRRGGNPDGILPLLPDAGDREVGASAVFRCEPDGVVYGFRYPFHPVARDVRPERFADLGEPAVVRAEAVGHAVADFLEWAAVGAGCGSRRLRFWAPPPADEAPAAPPLRLHAAA